MMMNLTPIGHSLGLVIDPSILERLKIDRETQLEVSTDGTVIYVRPIRFADHEEVMRTVDRVMEVHAETFRKLAESD
jgi:antitoxin component of MazEF toxin-antitoxin module